MYLSSLEEGNIDKRQLNSKWLGMERFSTHRTGTAETRRLFQHNYAHDREGSSYGDLPRKIRLPSRISEVHPCERDGANLKGVQVNCNGLVPTAGCDRERSSNCTDTQHHSFEESVGL